MPHAIPPSVPGLDAARGTRFALVAGAGYLGLAIPAAGAPQAVSGLLRLFVHELYLTPLLPLLPEPSLRGVVVGLAPTVAVAFLLGALPRSPLSQPRTAPPTAPRAPR